ncbi:hypothetical protein NP493_314g02032 [Ridgeia piscesae]|uniref:Ribosomal protein L34 n=1 Tax=Ridgeia piscesae TaxID=27915 RepID=A0AAD9NW13_RIDPI|nr:hypothetical protein NP493_314g02032 [Ridgeia piscesae]
MSLLTRCISPIARFARGGFQMLLSKPGVQGVSTSSTGAPLSTAVKSSLFSHLLGSGLVPGLTTVPVRGSARVMYKPNAVKRKRKHGFAKRCSSRRGLIVMWRRFLKNRHQLSV